MDIVASYANIYGYGEIYIEDTIQIIYRPEKKQFLYMRKCDNIKYLDVTDVYKFVTGLILLNVSGLYRAVNEMVPVIETINVDNKTIPAYNYSHFEELAKVCRLFDDQFSGR
jgi:hypothetical protein